MPAYLIRAFWRGLYKADDTILYLVMMTAWTVKSLLQRGLLDNHVK